MSSRTYLTGVRLPRLVDDDDDVAVVTDENESVDDEVVKEETVEDEGPDDDVVDDDVFEELSVSPLARPSFIKVALMSLPVESFSWTYKWCPET